MGYIIVSGDRHKQLQEVVAEEAEAVVEVVAEEVEAFVEGVVQEVVEVDLLEEVPVVVALGAEGDHRRILCNIICAFLYQRFHFKLQWTNENHYLDTNVNFIVDEVIFAILFVLLY